MIPGAKRIIKLWHRMASGVIVPNGYVADRSRSDSETYLEMKAKAQAVESFYADSGVPIPVGCSLAHLVQSAKELSDAWLIDGTKNIPNKTLWRAAHLARVSEAIIALRGATNLNLYLRKLINGSLDLLDRDQSVAKDFLWELELLHVLRVHGVAAELKEPPDIVATFEGSKIGIACKKVYSEENFEKVLSEGVSQIEQQYEFGIVAINIDAMTPTDSILVANTQEEMATQVSKLNQHFLRRHERHFRKYLSSGRLLSALISTSVLADLRNEKPRLNNARQSTVWMIPGLPVEKEIMFKKFYDRIMQ
jgi:hypothetical protein